MEKIKRVGKTLFVLFLCYHLAATLTTLVPAGSRARQLLQTFFLDYQCVSGTQQHWNMFVETARHRHSDVKVIFHGGEDQETIEVGPMLPSLGPYDVTRTFRHHTLISRIWFKESSKHMEALGQKYREAARSQAGLPADSIESIEVEFHYEEINPLVFIRIGGDIGFPHTLRREVWATEE